MNWDLLTIAIAAMMGIFIVVLLWGAGKAWKTKNKFIAFVLLALAVAMGVGFYAIYGKRFFG